VVAAAAIAAPPPKVGPCKKCTAPTAVTGAATNVTQTSVSLSGTVNPNGSESTYWFEYGPTSGYGSSTAAQGTGPGHGDVAASAALSGLAPATAYHYRLVASNGAGTTYGTDRSFTTLGSGPPPATGQPAIGTQFHCNWGFYTNPERTAVLDKLQAAGVQWVRIDTSWAGIEWAYKGDRNAAAIAMVDFCVNEARARGMKVLVMLWLTPAWANGGQGERVPPSNPQDYADFARWAASYWKGRVDAWEVWNEANPGNSFWQGTTAEYAALLKAAYPGFKGGDANAQVVLGGPSSNDDGWIRELYSLGVKGSFDVLATHPYQGVADAPPEQPDDGNRWWFTHLPAVRNVMLDYGDAATPIWFTEFGWSAHDDWAGIADWQRGVTLAEQADYLVRAIKYTTTNYPYVPVMFWYKERAMPGGTDPHQEGYGLLNADLSERPAYSALKSFLATR